MTSIRAWAAVHYKLITVVTGTALTVAIQIWGTSNPYVSLAILAATSFGVYKVPNKNAAGAPLAGTGPVSPPPGPVFTVPAAGNAGVQGAPASAAPSEAAGTGQAPARPG